MFEGELTMQITGQGALITGGAGGGGPAAGRRSPAAGGHVTIVDLASSKGAEMAAELGGRFVAADVTSAEDVEAAVAAAQKAAPLRIVVNCAGIAPPAKVLDREGNPAVLADFERIIRINLVGTFNVLSQASAVIARNPETEDGDSGVIINTASVAAFDGQIGQPAYAASKGGVHAMTLPVARELARYRHRRCQSPPRL